MQMIAFLFFFSTKYRKTMYQVVIWVATAEKAKNQDKMYFSFLALTAIPNRK